MKTFLPLSISPFFLFLNFFFTGKAKTLPYRHFFPRGAVFRGHAPRGVGVLSTRCSLPTPSCTALQSPSPQRGVCASLRKKVASLSQKRALLKGCTLATCRSFLEFLYFFAGLYQLSELGGPLCRMMMPLACKESFPQICSGHNIPDVCFSDVLLEDRASITWGLMLDILFLMTKQDCRRTWLSFPFISCYWAWEYLSRRAKLRQINRVLFILMCTRAILAIRVVCIQTSVCFFRHQKLLFYEFNK